MEKSSGENVLLLCNRIRVVAKHPREERQHCAFATLTLYSKESSISSMHSSRPLPCRTRRLCIIHTTLYPSPPLNDGQHCCRRQQHATSMPTKICSLALPSL
eukprot:10603_5